MIMAEQKLQVKLPANIYAWILNNIKGAQSNNPKNDYTFPLI